VHTNITSGIPNELRTQGPTTPFKHGTTVTGKKKERMTANSVLVVATFLRVPPIRQYIYHDKGFLVLGYLVGDEMIQEYVDAVAWRSMVCVGGGRERVR
jgi:hypothetical protein